MADGRVLIRRPTDGRHAFSLLYPTGPGTGELPLGAVACPDEGTLLRLLPCGALRRTRLRPRRRAPCDGRVAGRGRHLRPRAPRRDPRPLLGRRLAGPYGPHARAGSGARRPHQDDRGGPGARRRGVPLLQIAADSDDRLLLADPDSGLLLISSDAPSPGEARLGWGVLGSTLPVRFPECLHPPDLVLTPSRASRDRRSSRKAARWRSVSTAPTAAGSASGALRTAGCINSTRQRGGWRAAACGLRRAFCGCRMPRTRSPAGWHH